MKEMWNSFLQTVIRLVKDLGAGMTRAMNRSAVSMTVGISLVTMLTFMAGDLHVGGGNAMVAFAETQEHRIETETELETETTTETTEEIITEETIAEEIMAETTGEEALTEEKTETTLPQELTEEEKVLLPGYESEEDIVEVDLEAMKTANSKTIVLSESDYDTLCRIVQAESGGCDIQGKILVANVILNRVESDEFPDSIHGVVYQKSQFSPVIDGSINRCKVSDETREAVDRTLKGEDPSDGALYFMNRSKSAAKNVRWFDAKLSFLFKHGEHEFFK